jgi:hypothetical protein
LSSRQLGMWRSKSAWNGADVHVVACTPLVIAVMR